MQGFATDMARPVPRLRKRAFWIHRFLLLVLGVTVILPVAAIVLFRFVPAPMTPLMLGIWLADGPLQHRWVPLQAISPNLVKAVIASEDGKFCSHYGFDLQAIDKALLNNASGGTVRGASTISQQTAKNLFLSPSRTWLRKGIEAYLTVLIEALWPKRRIMETYLNIAQWGPRRFGAEAAAEANFKKPAAKLSVLEAARLATILPNPQLYRADAPGPYVARQSAVIAARMASVSRDRLDACIYP
jgi:monofunctional biosynthetic peptidoglycan transglycosylase